MSDGQLHHLSNLATAYDGHTETKCLPGDRILNQSLQREIESHLSAKQLDNSHPAKKRGRPRGTQQSPATKERIRQARLGKVHSAETRSKISRSRTTPEVPPVPLPPEVMAWWLFVNYSVRLRRRWIKNIDQVQVTELAAKLAVQGPPTDPKVQELYNVVIPLVLANYRLQRRSFKMNIALLPTDKRAMRWLYLAEAVAKAFGPLLKLQFTLENFAAAAAMCPNAKAAQVHVTRCLSGPAALEAPAPYAVLTPGAMDWSRNRYRGAFCEWTDVEEWQEQVRQKVKTIR